MASRLGWLDQDDAQRARMLEVLKLFQDAGSVDELGIGAIRDAFSDSFFPGTSVLHTRTRYLLFVPWLLQDASRRGGSLDDVRERLRKDEVRLIRALIAGGMQNGVIGSQAQDLLKTMPSQVYWASLRRFGIRSWDVSVDGWLGRAIARGRRTTEMGEDDSGHGVSTLDLLASLPPPPDDLLTSTTFDLTAQEAGVLRDVFVQVDDSCLLSWLAAHAESSEARYVWEHPQVGDLPDDLGDRVDHARRLHHVWSGAPLLYNLMLAKLSDDDERVSDYEGRTEDWLADVAKSRALDGWSRPDFWMRVRGLNPRLGTPTQNFVDRWIDLVEAGEHGGASAQRLVQDREVRLKGRRSRLLNEDARASWSGAAGVGALDFRWPVARQYLGDLLAGLAREDKAA